MIDFTSIGGTSPHEIYENITRKFTYPGGNGSKRKDDTIFFSNKYDEPTYLTFRIDFDFLNANFGNSYDELPHALLNVITEDFVKGDAAAPTLDIKTETMLANMSASDRKYIINDTWKTYKKISHNAQYSAYNYLKYALGETERARMLLQFKMGLYDLVKYCPYYFTSIDGVGNLMKMVPNNGVRVPKDMGTLTIKCEDALDMRVTQVMNLYRKIAWDDVYQRWILPDIMRYFKMYIYITEIRVFHSTPHAKSPLNNISSTIGGVVPTEFLPEVPDIEVPVIGNVNLSPFGSSDFELINHSMNNVMPTIKLECSMCEFDMSDVMGHINSLSSSKGGEPIKPTIKIHVGNVKETQVYGLNREFADRGSNNILDHIYSDNTLRKQNYIVDNLNNEDETENIDPIEQMTALPLQRLGVSIDDSDKYRPFNRTATEMASQVNGIMQKIKAEDALSVLTLSGIRQIDPRSMATSYRGNGILSTLLDSVIDQGTNQLSLATQSLIDRGMSYIFGFPLRNGVRFGDIIQTQLTGNPIPIISAIKDYTRDNAANQELKDLYNRDNWEEMLKEILKDVSRSAATEGISDRFTKTIDFILSNDPSAADIGRKIDQLYDEYQKGLSSEANTDVDYKGYQDPNLLNAEYRSSANENGPVTDPYNPELHGLSNEANEDSDKGYTKPNIYQSPYISTANTGTVNEVYDEDKKGTSDEANTDEDFKGYQDPNLVRPPFVSTANTGSVQDPYDPALHGLSDEANEDNDNGYTRPTIENPDYKSSANEGTVTDPYDPELHGLSNEAIEDNDNGYSEPTIENPEYRSTANEITGNPELYTDELHGLSDEANEDNDNGYNEQVIENPDYRSTATERRITTEPSARELYSEANENREGEVAETPLLQPDYKSTAAESGVETESTPRELYSEANENREGEYQKIDIDDAELRSTATEREIESKSKTRDIYSEANEDRNGGYTEIKIDDK